MAVMGPLPLNSRQNSMVTTLLVLGVCLAAGLPVDRKP